ncbi:hypothetical protein HOG16_00990 [Candidatus Woesearchaeota archaeon]|jgi:hypothetical protein|nr:hypothetical protein [Candidatus Woesearchaeota archaeon]MBT4322073.1 hypothetical protein [Candidatus Woesearchaeota archaeon]MBT4630650.1 hypothetical protein [Candidatus Woesearchaeota archaeon]
MKKNRNKLYIGLFIVFLMVSSTIGFLYSSEDSKKVNGNKFTLTDKGWQLYSGGNYWYFDYLPSELNFESDMRTISNLVYVSVLDNQYFYEISNKFALLGVVVERVSLEEIDCDTEITTLVFMYENDNKIYKEGSCVYFEGREDMLIDKLFYEMLGVI